MKGSLKIGTFAGIGVFVHWTFWLLIGWILVTGLVGGQAFAATWLQVAFILALFGCVVLHEFGHAYACKRYGGEVREMGALWIFFTPCLFCNVSDAWLLPSRWRRRAAS